MKKIAVFASGGGSNFKAIYAQIQSGVIPAEIVLVVSNNPNCGAIKFAQENEIETLVVNAICYPNPDDLEAILVQKLGAREVDLICLAGYMKMVPPSVVSSFRNQILNIHPALLPDFGGRGFYGMRVHEEVIKSGVKESGATVHCVDEEYDHGHIIAQLKVQVEKGDTPETLAKRVLNLEHQLYPKVVEAYCKDEIKWEGSMPQIMETNEN